MGFFQKVAEYISPRRMAPLQTPQTTSETKPAGVPGYSITGGFLQSNETSGDLSGQQKYTTYGRVLLNTSIVAAGVRHFGTLLSGVRWNFQPPDDSDRAKELSEKMCGVIEEVSDSWSRVIRRQGMYRFYGANIQEKIKKKLTRKDLKGVIGLDLYQRPMKTIEQWDTDGNEVLGVGQRDPNDGSLYYIGRDRMFYSVDDNVSDSPEGIGLLRHVVEAARRLARYEQLEGYGFETDLRGIPIGRAPIALLDKLVQEKKISKDEASRMLQGIKDFMNGHVKSPTLNILLDSTPWTDQGENATPISMRQWDVELLKTDSGAQEPVNVVVERLNREIARVLGVEYLLLGSGSHGSQALSQDKTQAFAAMIQATVDEIATQVDKDIVPWVWERNGWPTDLMPKSRPDAVRLRDVKEVVDTLVKLAQSGAPMMPNDPAVNEVRTMINVSRAPEVTPEQMMLQQQAGAKPRGLGAGAPPGSGSGGAQGGVPRAAKPDAPMGEPKYLTTPPKEG